MIAFVHLLVVALYVDAASACNDTEHRKATERLVALLFSGYDYGRLPAQPTNISLSATVAKINEIRTSDQTVHLNMFMRHGWTDTRLTWNATEHCGVEMIMLRPEDLIWRPDSFFANSNEIKSPDGEEYTKLWHDGFILWSKRMVLTIFCDMSFRHFPFDSQECVSVLESYGYPTRDLIFDILQEGVAGKEEVPFGFSISLTSSGAYRLLSPEVTVVPPASYSGVEFSKVEFKYKFERNRSRYIVSMFIPLLLVVSISFVGLWIDAGSIPARTAIAATTLLMLVTLMYTLTKELPTTVYLTSLDYYFIICFLFLFFNACEYALVNYLTTRHAKLESDIGKRRAQRAKLRGPRDALMVEGGPAEVQHRKQRAELKEVFKLYDHSKTGSITTQDLGSLLLAFAEDRGCDLSVEEVQEWVYQCDTDQSGTIEFDELCNFAETHLDTFMNQEEARALLICGSFPVTRRSIITIERRYRILSPCLFMAATRMRLLGTI